jgi:hypothetical protein
MSCVVLLMLHRCILLFEDLDDAFTSGIMSTADPTANTNGGPAISLSGLQTSLDSAEGRCGVTVSIRALGFANRLGPRLSWQARFRYYQSL